MSAFTESALIKKLGDLNTSSQSIQTLSLWLIHHRKHNEKIVSIWMKELSKAPSNRKLVFMYLANDVIQNSKKKGPEFGNSFATILPKAFKDISHKCSDDKTFNSLTRILNIWGERGVYDSAKIKEYSSNLRVTGSSSSVKSSGSSSVKSSGSSSVKNSGSSNDKPKEESASRKRKATDELTPNTSNGSDSKRSSKVPTPSKAKILEVNGEKHVTLSPTQQPVGDPPEPEELIKMLESLEEAASSDAATREKITRLPPEVSSLDALSKLEDKEAAASLHIKVNEAVQLLKDYNSRLAAEMNERNKLTVMLKDFQKEQQELLAQAEQRLEEYTAKLDKVKEVQSEIKNHLAKLPDISFANLPDFTGNFASLPSAADLFNVHH
ncbi:regulation of nuclear pre-mRNA domain-containing protein 1B [Chironomus tepperi]|uniref:regulation of nuclear pre-mRNA domain-containing protein 1B n=1 Tax=Chironomus tepperi TaxID=113505 RepID=UPI00391F4182